MIEPSERESLLNHVLRLRKERRYPEIEQLLKDVPESLLERDGALSLELATALSEMVRGREAKAVLLNAEAEIARSGDARLLRRWQQGLSVCLADEGDLIPAERLAREALAMSERHSDLRMIAHSNNSLGIIQFLRGEAELAVCSFARALFAHQSLGNAYGVGAAHHNLGLTLRGWGHATEALPHFNYAEEYFDKDGIEEERVYVRAARAHLFKDLGDLTLAEHLARSAVADSASIASNGVKADALLALGCVLASGAKYAEAELSLLSALELMAEAASTGTVRGEILEELAIVNLFLAKYSEAERRRDDASAEYGRLGAIERDRRLQLRYSSALAGSGNSLS